jgi:hypothetical protein
MTSWSEVAGRDPDGSAFRLRLAEGKALRTPATGEGSIRFGAAQLGSACDHFRDRLRGADCVRVVAGVQSTSDVLAIWFLVFGMMGFQNETQSPVRHP